jgi:Protein of unknown function (DUF2723)
VKSERTAGLVAGGIGLAAFVLYALTAEHTVPSGDSGELIAAASVLGVAHPPGYPLYILLGHLATSLPGGSAALRMNLLSGALDAFAVAVVFLTSYRLIGTDSGRLPVRLAAAAVGALLLAFSSLFWAYSVVAEVFALNNLLAALLLFVGCEWCRRPERVRLLWLLALLLGLAFSNQQTIVLLVPALAVLGVRAWRRISLRNAGIACGALLAGLLPYAYLPVAASANPELNWGDPTTWSRFENDVTRGDYGTTTLVASGRSGSVAANLAQLWTSLVHGFVYAGILLALAGLWWAWEHRRIEGAALLTAFVVAGPLFQAYTRTAYPDPLIKGVVARFYLLPSIPLAILAGLGAWWALAWVDRQGKEAATVIAAAVLLAIPAAAAADHYSSADQSGNHVTEDYARDLLGGLAPNALLVMRGDENYTSVSYAQDVEHLRPDVVALDAELLKSPSYVAQMLREHPRLTIPFVRYDGVYGPSLNTLVAANLASRPVYSIGAQEEKRFGAPFAQVHAGLATRLEPKGSASDPYALMRMNAAPFERLHYPTREYPATSWENRIGQVYAAAALDLAYALDNGHTGNVALVDQLYRTAIRLSPGLTTAYRNLGLSLYRHGGDPADVVAVWSAYLQLDPSGPQAAQIAKVVSGLEAGRK